MRQKDYMYTAIALFLSHFLISVFMALACGTTHPLAGLYQTGKPLIAILVCCLICVPVYAAAGYLFILGKEYLGGMNLVLKKCCLYAGLSLLALYAFCYLLASFNIVRGIWMYYVLLNYPAALLFNSISLMTDGLNLWFILTVIPAPLGFYLGGLARYRYESITVTRNSK